MNSSSDFNLCSDKVLWDVAFGAVVFLFAYAKTDVWNLDIVSVDSGGSFGWIPVGNTFTLW